MLNVQHISGGYDEQCIVKDVSFSVPKGQVLGILGPNGSGKSTLLKIIAGILTPVQGEIFIDGQPLSSYNAKKLAQKMAVLPQMHANAFANTVYQTVSLGRYPHQRGFFSSWSVQDEEAVQRAMAQTGVARYAHHALQFLSGGEQQRVFIAQALAQQAQILLLDEPTNHLDIAHQKQILDLIRGEAIEHELTIISVFHDINLASLYCDKLLLMEHGKMKYYGEPHEVVRQEQIEEVYEARVTTYVHPEIAKPQMMILPAIEHSSIEIVTLEDITVHDDFVRFQASAPLKVVSSAVHNAGVGWYDTIINRKVQEDYRTHDVTKETISFLNVHNMQPTNTVVMLTAIAPQYVATAMYTFSGGSLLIAVTAGVGKAIDVTKAYLNEEKPYVGTINTWVIVNGKLEDEAFFQAMITATEAKTKALYDEQIKDENTGTFATGTATDSLLIGATQQGENIRYAGPVTPLGKAIGKGVYEMTLKAIQNTKKGRR